MRNCHPDRAKRRGISTYCEKRDLSHTLTLAPSGVDRWFENDKTQ